MQISDEGLALIKKFEGFVPSPYQDSVGVWTIGYGTIMYPNGIKVTNQDDNITENQALQYLTYEVNQKCNAINQMVTVEINQNQFDALCSFTYNLGIGAFHGSTLLKLLNSGDIQGAADQFLVWDKAGGNIIAGLLRRRTAERALFLY